MLKYYTLNLELRYFLYSKYFHLRLVGMRVDIDRVSKHSVYSTVLSFMVLLAYETM